MRAVMATKSDLRNWVDTHLGADGTPEIIDAVTEYFQGRDDHPNWGEDWSEWLAGFDLWHVVTGLQL